MIAGLRHVGRLRHESVVHLNRYGFSGSDFYSPVIRQDVFFSVLAGHFGYGVFADPKLNVDFAVLIRLKFLRIGVAHEVGAGNFEGAASMLPSSAVFITFREPVCALLRNPTPASVSTRTTTPFSTMEKG